MWGAKPRTPHQKAEGKIHRPLEPIVFLSVVPRSSRNQLNPAYDSDTRLNRFQFPYLPAVASQEFRSLRIVFVRKTKWPTIRCR